MDIKRQKFLVFGLSKSGVSAAKFLLAHGAEVHIYEELDSEKIRENAKELAELGAIDCARTNRTDECDILVLSPGVPINHPLPVEYKKRGKRVIGELELGALFVKSPVAAVTGTNGKTTVCNIVSEMLTAGGVENRLAGNIGTPLTAEADTLGDKIAVVEVSSFQLETAHLFTPHVACVLNLSPDHLDRHYSMENYTFLKKRILKNMRESEIAVLNYDDAAVRAFAENAKCRLVWFSAKEKVDGAYISEGKIFLRGEYVCDESAVNLGGIHRVENALAAMCIADAFGVGTTEMLSALKGFKGVRHRNEFVRTVNGVSFFNDSKGTNTAAALAAAESMRSPTVIILGGKDKGEDYAPLFNGLKPTAVKGAVLVGESRFKMLDAALKCDYKNITLTNDFSAAVKIAAMLAERGGNVLLSPATASFDMFGGYEERGETFCKIVEGLYAETEE
ncbi:MAG: UDP-N-acetylmuramoyl-L-alanine--D-glutamate ligase [Bacillota bacterium]|nr:MAG: UDP-N-acetylmuramoyl-L-alanine--D-glutamate ligase [Bacillota bacterium]